MLSLNWFLFICLFVHLFCFFDCLFACLFICLTLCLFYLVYNTLKVDYATTYYYWCKSNGRQNGSYPIRSTPFRTYLVVQCKTCKRDHGIVKDNSRIWMDQYFIIEKSLKGYYENQTCKKIYERKKEGVCWQKSSNRKFAHHNLHPKT